MKARLEFPRVTLDVKGDLDGGIASEERRSKTELKNCI
jgi:hypothetical protein